MITLKTKLNEIDGTVHVGKAFTDLNDMARIDLLQDWILMLDNLYKLEKSTCLGTAYEQNTACARNTFIQGKRLLKEPDSA